MVSLNKFSQNVYSQFGEDGIIQELLNLLEESVTLDKWCCEFGAWDGLYLSNTANLIKNKGYKAVLIEGDRKRVQEMYKNFPNENVVKILSFVHPYGHYSLDEILTKTGIPKNFDFLSIDVDGVDYWIFDSLSFYLPKIVCIEFNPTIPNEVDFVQECNLNVKQGSSAKAIMRLGRSKGYQVAAITTCNVILVKDNLFKSIGLKPMALSHLFPRGESAQYIFAGYDGTILSNKDSINLNWHHEVPIRKIQPLPSYLRKYSGDFNWSQRIIFKIYCRIFLKQKSLFTSIMYKFFRRTN